MHFIQKIYYSNKPLILTTDSKQYIAQYPAAKNYICVTGAAEQHYKLALQQLEQPKTEGVIMEDESPERLHEELFKLYKPIDAGGGVVVNEHAEVLMIYRRGKWDLPKGKRDEGEDIAACALREVSEETGLQQLTLDEKICETYHVYSQYGENLLKRTVWYRMKGTLQEQLVPQEEENILEARWIAEKDLAPIMAKTYDAIHEVMQQAGYKW